jgi:hypothetical protein
MGDGNGGGGCGEGSAERACRVPLHNKQDRTISEQRRHGLRHRLGMGVVIGTAGAIQPDVIETRKAMLRRIQRVLSGEDKARRQAAARQCGGYGRKLDRFWTGSDNEVDTRTIQPSP